MYSGFTMAMRCWVAVTQTILALATCILAQWLFGVILGGCNDTHSSTDVFVSWLHSGYVMLHIGAVITQTALAYMYPGFTVVHADTDSCIGILVSWFHNGYNYDVTLRRCSDIAPA